MQTTGIIKASLKDILNEDVRLDRKRGFNVSINSIIDFKDQKVKDLTETCNRYFQNYQKIFIRNYLIE